MKKIIQKTIGFYFNFLGLIHPKLIAHKGFQLFCSPMPSRLKKHQLDFLETGKHQILNFENEKIQTYKWGNGSQKILLIHGWASHSFRWKNYIQELNNNNCTVYAFDAQAHGLSSGKTLNVASYAQIIDLFIKNNEQIDALISHSIGSFATTYWLFQNPENTMKKIVIMGAPENADDFFTFYKKALGLTNRTVKIVIQQFIKNLDHAPSYFSTSIFAKTIHNDCLIIHDKEDKEADFNYSIKLHKNWKNSELLLTEGLGHNLKSNEIIEKVVSFVKK